MTDARFRIQAAGPLVTLQDAGRRGHLRHGVPGSGPMDRFGFAAAHALLGRETTGTAIEVSLGGLALDWVEGTCTVAVAGGGFRCTLDGVRHEGWDVLTLTPGSRLTITGGAWGSWCYLAFAGTLDVPRWLGAAATHGQSGLGGGMLAPGQMIRVTGAEAQPARNGAYDIPPIAKPRDTLRVVPGPQDHLFDADALTQLSSAAYKVTDAYDRMGIRLDGPTLALADALSIPSEPILRGSIQVTGTGVPTILMADHQTTGGYPKIATVISADLAPLSQHRAGDDLRFKAVTPEAANAEARAYAEATHAALEALRAPRLSLDDRLARENLISGVTDGGQTGP